MALLLLIAVLAGSLPGDTTCLAALRSLPAGGATPLPSVLSVAAAAAGLPHDVLRSSTNSCPLTALWCCMKDRMAVRSSLLHRTCTSESALVDCCKLSKPCCCCCWHLFPPRWGDLLGLRCWPGPSTSSCCCCCSWVRLCLLRGVPATRGEVEGLTKLISGVKNCGWRLGWDSCRQLWLLHLRRGIG